MAHVVFLLLGAITFAVLAVSYHRRQDLERTAVAAGVVGAPVMLGGMHVVIPAVRQAGGLMPST